MKASTLEKLKPAKDLKLQGLSYPEIAEQIGLSISTVNHYFQIGNDRPGPGLCALCGQEVPIRARHHPSYGNLKEVVHVCKTCHLRLHRQECNRKLFEKWHRAESPIPEKKPDKCPCCWGTGLQLDMEQLGAIAREYRKCRKESLRSLSRRLGMSAAMLSLLEKGRRNWTQDLFYNAIKDSP